MGAHLLLTAALLAGASISDGEDPYEVARIQAHLSLVERTLRGRQVSSFSEGQRSERLKNLDRLHAYWTRGVFPHNHQFEGRTPFFIDHRGVACAVGQLLLDSGETELAHEIAAKENNAKLKQMHFPALLAWQGRSGLSLDELAWIQPSYDGRRMRLEYDPPPAAIYFDGKTWQRLPGLKDAAAVELLAPGKALVASRTDFCWSGTAPGVGASWTGASGSYCASFRGDLGSSGPGGDVLARGSGDTVLAGYQLNGPQLRVVSLQQIQPLKIPAKLLEPAAAQTGQSPSDDADRSPEDGLDEERSMKPPAKVVPPSLQGAHALFQINDEIWVSLNERTLLHRKGGKWAKQQAPTAPAGIAPQNWARVIWGAVPNDVWFVHQNFIGRWNGKSLARYDWPFEKTMPLSWIHSLHGTSPSDVWAAGENAGRSAVFHFDGEAWSQVDVPNAGPLTKVVALSSGGVVALGIGRHHHGLLRFDGKEWSVEKLPEPESWGLMSALPSGEIFIHSVRDYAYEPP